MHFAKLFQKRSIKLRVELLQRGAHIWTEEELKKRWEGLVFSNPHLPELWRAFLDIQSNKPVFFVLKFYNKCFETLSEGVRAEKNIEKNSADTLS